MMLAFIMSCRPDQPERMSLLGATRCHKRGTFSPPAEEEKKCDVQLSMTPDGAKALG